MQHRLGRIVTEGHIGEAHIAAQQRVPAVRGSDCALLGLGGDFTGLAAQFRCGGERTRAVVIRRAFPRPMLRLPVGFRHRAPVFAEFDVDKRDRTAISFHRFVHQREDA